MKNKSQTQRERLESVLSAPPQHYLPRMRNYLVNKINYLSQKNYVLTSIHIELLYIAKKKPETFLNRDIQSFITNIVDDHNKEIPKGLATTLFMIFGQVYRAQPKPPLIMAKLLFRDVIDAQEFCHFEKAAEFIQRVQLTYFFQLSLLNTETKLALYRQSKPAAEEVPDSYFQWDPEITHPLAQLQKNVNSKIKAIKNHEKDPHYADVLVFFMTMPEGQLTFINEFDYLCATFPKYIPQMFLSVQFFLLSANASDSLVSDFAKQFAQLHPTICVEEYQDALSKITTLNQQYFPIISGAKLTFTINKDNLNMTQNSIPFIKQEATNQPLLSAQTSGMIQNYPSNDSSSMLAYTVNSRNANDQVVQYLIHDIFKAPDDIYFENLRKLNEQYSQTKPPLSYTCEILTKFLNEIPTEDIKIDNVSHIVSTFDTFLKNTIFINSQQPQKKPQQQQQSPINNINYLEVSELILLFVTKLSQTQLLNSVSKSLTNIIVPIALKNDGLPFKQDSLAPFISNSSFHQIAYHMIYSAAKYQIKCNSMYPAVLPPQNTIIVNNINNFINSQSWNVGAKSFALGCLLIVISPESLGASLYRSKDKLRKMFLSFLRKFLARPSDPDSLIDDIDFEEPINKDEEMKKFITKVSKLKYLSSDPVLNCRDPNYLDDLLTKEEKLTSISKYITSKITKEMVQNVSFIGITKYVFASLIALANSRENLTVAEIYRQEKVHEWVELIIQKRYNVQEVNEMLMFYARYLEKKERWLRVAAYVMILVMNAQIINDLSLSGNNSANLLLANNSDSIGFESASEKPSRENSAVIQANNDPTSVCIPICKIFNGNLVNVYIVFKFYLPDNEETVGIISRSLYIDNEVEIAKALVLFLSCSKFAGNALAEFVEKRPLLANCLQEPSLSKYLKYKFSYDLSYTPRFDFPNFQDSLSLNASKNQRYEYHDVLSKRPNLTDLSTLPIEDSPTVINEKYIKNSKNDQKGVNNSESNFLNHFEYNGNLENQKTNEFESSQLELEVYRFEMILYSGSVHPPAQNSEEAVKSFFYEDSCQWFALASLKRYVLNNQDAFLLYARPTLNILYTEIKHANFLTKIMMNRFISLLSICYIKLIHQRNALTEKEQEFVHNTLLPKLEEISKFDQFEQYGTDLPPMISSLLSSILNNFDNRFNSSTKMKFAHSNLNSISSSQSNSYFSKKKLNTNNNNNNISSFVLPFGIPIEMVADNNDMLNAIQQSLIVTTDEYASKWLLEIAVKNPFLINQNKNFKKCLLIPLILSSRKDAVVDFFRLMKEQILDDTQKLMDTIATIVNSVFGYNREKKQ